MKIELVKTLDEREGAGKTAYGSSPFRSLGFKLFPENDIEKEFLHQFDVLHEDNNGNIDYFPFDNDDNEPLIITTNKTW